MAHMAGLNLARQWAARKGCKINATYEGSAAYLIITKDDAEIGRTLLGSWDGTPAVALHPLSLILEPLPNATT